MSYLTVISLAEAKQYLRVDDGFTADDALITMLINTVSENVERYTNHILYSRNKKYFVPATGLRVYDYPITATVSGHVPDSEAPSHVCYITSDSEVELTVGYADPADVPATLKLAILEGINTMYNGNDNDGGSTALGAEFWARIQPFKRFVI